MVLELGYMYKLIKSCHRQHETERKEYQISDKCISVRG